MERFIDKIVERKNLFIEEVREAIKNGGPLYIYGAGLAGEHVQIQLEKLGVEYKGKVVDEEYVEGSLLCITDVLESEDNVNLIIAHRGFMKEKLSKYENNIGMLINRDCFCGNSESVCDYITYEWLLQNEEKLQWMYDHLKDELSKRTFIAYINQKLSANQIYLKEVKSANQYFDEFVILGNDEVFIDCGGFDGDTAESFIEALNKRGIYRYNEIISFEPDRENIEKMKRKKIERHKCIPKCVAEKRDTVTFSENGTAASKVSTEGVTVMTESIDEYIKGKRVTFIKMDIEGSELSALKGAKDTIYNFQPTLAICIYHKKEDLYEIGQYIHSVFEGYDFYVRGYWDEAIELVLYAIPRDC